MPSRKVLRAFWLRPARQIDLSPIHKPFMKHDKLSQKPSGASRPIEAADLNENEIDFAPSADEVARRAYFSYVNQGAPQGQDVQHWLVAEAELLAERDLTRAHGFQHQTKNKMRAEDQKEINP
jgi:hypothetical protein